ncbi:MAG: type II toxin-antitoxin system RelB/DinJ family antitoxin [Eggerthellales bacterium]|nr:type II toxin-antitoxin system RelB/DinJ family antitoxin [Eggerthellales bacterium]
MAKDATVGARVDAELKERAQEAFDKMGLPMSLGIELFLRQVAETGKLPFALAANGVDEMENSGKKEQERDFWRSYICWNFDAWPHFDLKKAEERARDELGFDGKAPGADIRKIIGSEEVPTQEDRRAAEHDLFELQRLASDAKELIYWALGMEKVFVPSLSGEYCEEADEWRLRHVQARSKGSFGFGMHDDAACLPNIDDLDDDELMTLLDEWLLESGVSGDVENLLLAATDEAADFEQIRPLLDAAGLLDDFEDYVEEARAARS